MSALNASQSRFSVFSGDADFWDRQDFQDQLLVPPICVHPRPVFTAHRSLLTFIRIVVLQRLGDGAWHQAVDRLPKPKPLANGGRRYLERPAAQYLAAERLGEIGDCLAGARHDDKLRPLGQVGGNG